MIEPPAKQTNWVFLGDSITEGIGSSRVSYVSELVKLLRRDSPVPLTEVRLKRQANGSFNQLANCNLAGNIDEAPFAAGPRRWIWNLGNEGTSSSDDSSWFSLIANLRPDAVFILRGEFETIVRPLEVVQGRWPGWVPRGWRSAFGLDPRCYFSSTWWRAAKQRLIDFIKQRIRLAWLGRAECVPLINDERFLGGVNDSLELLASTGARVFILAMLPISERLFPKSGAAFAARNRQLEQIALTRGMTFIEWDRSRLTTELFYRDGLHPNPAGAAELARQLHAMLKSE